MKTKEQILKRMKSTSKQFDIEQKEYLKDSIGTFESRGQLLKELRVLAWVIGMKNHDKFITQK